MSTRRRRLTTWLATAFVAARLVVPQIGDLCLAGHASALPEASAIAVVPDGPVAAASTEGHHEHHGEHTQPDRAPDTQQPESAIVSEHAEHAEHATDVASSSPEHHESGQCAHCDSAGCCCLPATFSAACGPSLANVRTAVARDAMPRPDVAERPASRAPHTLPFATAPPRLG